MQAPSQLRSQRLPIRPLHTPGAPTATRTAAPVIQVYSQRLRLTGCAHDQNPSLAQKLWITLWKLCWQHAGERAITAFPAQRAFSDQIIILTIFQLLEDWSKICFGKYSRSPPLDNRQ